MRFCLERCMIVYTTIRHGRAILPWTRYAGLHPETTTGSRPFAGPNRFLVMSSLVRAEGRTENTQSDPGWRYPFGESQYHYLY